MPLEGAPFSFPEAGTEFESTDVVPSFLAGVVSEVEAEAPGRGCTARDVTVGETELFFPDLPVDVAGSVEAALAAAAAAAAAAAF